MNITTVHSISFSPAGSTKKVVNATAKGISANVIRHDITQGIKKTIEFSENELAVIGVPSYSGRVPALAIKYLSEIKTNGTPAIIVCVYGNREYDDTLLELKNICTEIGFSVISAGAFIARHSIFPKVAEGRPSIIDLESAGNFGKESLKYISSGSEKLEVKGNFPYRETKSIPLKPKGSFKCDRCGICVTLCPVDAIDKKHPRSTDKSKCISCGRCIEFCPQKARNFRGIIYKIATNRFVKNFSREKEIELFFPE